jgi:hypothetical protein
MRQPSMSLLVAFAAVFAVSFMAYGQLGGPDGIQIPYQGRLENGGVPANGPHDFRFSIYNDAVGGTSCDTFEVATLVSAGAFAVNIGPVDEGCVRGRDVYLEIEVSADAAAGYSALDGRQRIYAATAASTSGTGDFAVEGDLAVEGAATVGPAYIGEVGANTAGFAHRDAATGTAYALRTNSAGTQTQINVASGGVISFRANNSDVGTLDSSGNLVVSGGLFASGSTGIIKRPEALNLGQTYTAATDGIVTAFANGDLNNPCQIYITVDTPAFAPITHYSFSANAHISLPVPRGSDVRRSAERR